jgi:hypothetical protein
MRDRGSSWCIGREPSTPGRAHGWPRIALQLPASHAQRPPQSIVFGWHTVVHIVPAQSGLALAGAQVDAWQQPAGTQSASTAHSDALPASPALAVPAVSGAPAVLAGDGDGAGCSAGRGAQASVNTATRARVQAEVMRMRDLYATLAARPR